MTLDKIVDGAQDKASDAMDAVSDVASGAKDTAKTVGNGIGRASDTLSDVMFYATVATESVLQYVLIPLCLYKMSKNNQLGHFFGKGQGHQSIKNMGIALFIVLYIFGDVMSLVSTIQSVRCRYNGVKDENCRPSPIVRRGLRVSKVVVLVLAVMGLTKFASSGSPRLGVSAPRY